MKRIKIPKAIILTLTIGLLMCTTNPIKAQTVDSLSRSYFNANLSVYIQIFRTYMFSIEKITYHNSNDTMVMDVCLFLDGSASPLTLNTTLQAPMTSIQVPHHYTVNIYSAALVGGIPDTCANYLSTTHFSFPSIPVGIEENSSSNSINIYPNPTQNNINLDIKKNKSVNSLILYDITGRIVKTFNPTQRKLNLTDFKSGQYFLKIETENGVITKKVMID